MYSLWRPHDLLLLRGVFFINFFFLFMILDTTCVNTPFFNTFWPELACRQLPAHSRTVLCSALLLRTVLLHCTVHHCTLLLHYVVSMWAESGFKESLRAGRQASSTEISFKEEGHRRAWRVWQPPSPPQERFCLCRGHSLDETVNIQPFNDECFHQLCRYTGKENA